MTRGQLYIPRGSRTSGSTLGTPAQASSSSTLLRRQVATINYVSGGSSQRVTKDAPVLNRPRHPEHDPPTQIRLLYSPRGRVYLPPLVEIEPASGLDPFPDPCESDFNTYLATSNNRKIFTMELRDHYRRHLRNPLAGGRWWCWGQLTDSGIFTIILGFVLNLDREGPAVRRLVHMGPLGLG
jgi:hypothetical protein